MSLAIVTLFLLIIIHLCLTYWLMREIVHLQDSVIHILEREYERAKREISLSKEIGGARG